MDKLGLLLSKKVLVILSGVMFTGIAFASSGAQSLIQNSVFASSEAKIPEVQKVANVEGSPTPVPAQSQSPKANKPVNSPVQVPTPKPVVQVPTPIPVKKPAPILSAAIKTPAPKPIYPTPIPSAKTAQTLSSSVPKTITGFGEDRDSREEDSSEDREDGEDREDDSTESEISEAFQRARSDD